jgi:hypothetical protein
MALLTVLFSAGDRIIVNVGIPILFQVLRALFPGHERAYAEFLLAHMNDEEVMLGIMVGGQQYSDFIAKPDAKGAPMGFARFILKEKDN